jgi:hypothetical protein
MKRLRTAILTLLTSILLSDSLFAQKTVLIIPVEINSTQFTCGQSEMEALLAQTESYYSLLDGKYPCKFTLAPTVRLTSARYTSETAAMAALEAYRACARQLDLEDYEDDFGIIFSGSDIWPHEGVLRGTGINYFATSETFQEMTLPLGVFCHEYAHLLGLKDLYDTDGEKSGGESIGLWGSLSLMDKGDNGLTPCALNAIDRHLLGLTQVDTLTTGHYDLEPVTENGRYLLLPTDRTGEYFLLETRVQEGPDANIGGSGLLIYHIDRSTNKAGYSTYYDKILTAQQRWEYNEVNCRVDHQCALLLEAYPGTEDVSGVFFPYREGQSITNESTPALRSWSGAGNKYAIRNIYRNSDGSIGFDVIEPLKEYRVNVYQTAALLCWTLDSSLTDTYTSCEVQIQSDGREDLIYDGTMDADGQISVYLTDLESNTSYSAELLVHLKDEDYSISTSFKTLVTDERNDIPFIYISKESGRTIPLYVFNSQDALEIRWTFEGMEITPDAKGCYTLPGSGILRAELVWEDGTSDIICKEITVR